MNTRGSTSEPISFPVTTTVVFEGKQYCLCSNGQMNYLLRNAREKILAQAMDEEQELSEEEIQAKLREWEKTCPLTTMPKLFERMTPVQREDWKAKYRFSPLLVGRGGGKNS